MHRRTLTDLDELGEIMTELLERQQNVEVRLSDLLRVPIHPEFPMGDT